MPRAGWLFALVLVARTAAAEPQRVAVDTPLEAFRAPAAGGPGVLYLNRCTGGCTIHGTGGTGGTQMNDASMNMTTIASAGTYTVGEYMNGAGVTGAGADEEWGQLVQCMKEVYSPYNVTVTDQLPVGQTYDMAIIAGRPQDVGLGNDILGIAPLAADCSPQSNVMSFSFANYHGNVQRVNNICWTAAQESAHAYGLDHEFQFTDGETACSDPMTYSTACGGEKFFRNRRAKCGENAVRGCKCGAAQNSHQKLLTVFGEGTPITPAPHVAVTFPLDGSNVNTGWVVHAGAGSKRGVAQVELYLNGSRWSVVKGQGFGALGQADPSDYTLPVSNKVPDGIMDVKAIAYDDLGIATESASITVTKGAPCASDSTCLKDQHCESGKCVWPAPKGELGDSCSYDQQCKAWTCLGDESGKYCTTPCYTDESTCPADFTCVPTGSQTDGFCIPDGGGCCSASGDGRHLWLQLCMSVLVLTWLVRRKR